MKFEPRTVRLVRSLLSAALALALLSTPAWPQQRRRAKPKPEAGNAERARRALALTLLVETADKARLFDDLYYRARVQSLAANALWPHDERQARAIFRRAWEAAAASDKAEQEEAAQEASALSGSVTRVTEARDEILRMAAARDSRLADAFLRELTVEKDGAGVNQNESARQSPLRELSASGKRRLALAYEMLGDGQMQRAAEIAAPLINEGVSVDLITFIARLSGRDWHKADALYLRLLEHAAADPLTNANAVLILSSRFVSPTLLVVVDQFGSLQFRSLPHPLGNFSGFTLPKPSGRQAFFNLAANVLSRPLAPRDALTMQELMSRFYATGRLLPSFENSSEPHSVHAPALRVRLSELFNEIEAGRREQFSSQFTVTSMTQTAMTDPLRLQTEELTHATDPAERARLALSVVRAATRIKSWDRARRAAAEIEDTEMRRAALSFIQVHQIKDIADAYKDEKEDDFESVAKFVRDAYAPAFAKAWGLAQSAIIAARKRNSQTAQTVAELINEAESYAARAEMGTHERVAAYGAVLMVAARLDSPRAWSTLRELVKAANAVEDFTGDDDSVDLSSDEAAERFSVEDELFRLDGIFATMAQLDFDKALAEARALDGDVPQALAMIAVARTILEK